MALKAVRSGQRGEEDFRKRPDASAAVLCGREDGALVRSDRKRHHRLPPLRARSGGRLPATARTAACAKNAFKTPARRPGSPGPTSALDQRALPLPASAPVGPDLRDPGARCAPARSGTRQAVPHGPNRRVRPGAPMSDALESVSADGDLKLVSGHLVTL